MKQYEKYLKMFSNEEKKFDKRNKVISVLSVSMDENSSQTNISYNIGCNKHEF